jgi:hypothetical protein
MTGPAIDDALSPFGLDTVVLGEDLPDAVAEAACVAGGNYNNLW